MTKAVAINVGVNTKQIWGGFRGPIFFNGSFEFIHIPWEEDYGEIQPPPEIYNEMYESKFKIPEGLKNKPVLDSPDFHNCAYASIEPAYAKNKSLLSLESGDYLLFYATLDFVSGGGKKEDWINPNWGAYIVGLFQVDFVCESIREVLSSEAATKAFSEYAWFKSCVIRGIQDDKAPWIKGIDTRSGLLETAIPLSDPNNSQKWSILARELFRTAGGNKLNLDKQAVFQAVLTCEGENLQKLLQKCTLRKKT